MSPEDRQALADREEETQVQDTLKKKQTRWSGSTESCAEGVLLKWHPQREHRR